MGKGRRFWLRQVVRLGFPLAFMWTAAAQGPFGAGNAAPEPPVPAKRPALPVLPDRIPDKPSSVPSFSIQVEPMGFSPPGPIYFGRRNALVSLDFLSENQLLFTFRVPGLLHRDARAGEDQREIRAVVVDLPSGRVETEALWTVHDRSRYLWMLRDGRFLFRDRDDLKLGDRSLELTPFLHFPGPVLFLEVDPSESYLVADSLEPRPAESQDGDASNSGDASRAASNPPAPGTMSADGDSAPADPEFVVRILRRDSGEVILLGRTRSTVHLPLSADGYLEALPTSGTGWLIDLNRFSGGDTVIGHADSSCPLRLDFLSVREFLATACSPDGEGKLVALTTDGRELWEMRTSERTIWPNLVRSSDGFRLGREVLAVRQPVGVRAPVDMEDVKGQLVQVLDALDGRVVLQTAASPVFDAGGNLALSPSGRRAAVLNGGEIQIFDLPAPPPLPAFVSAAQPR